MLVEYHEFGAGLAFLNILNILNSPSETNLQILLWNDDAAIARGRIWLMPEEDHVLQEIFD